MATLGFEQVKIGIHDGDTETINKVYTINASNGGAIEAKLSGLQAEVNTLYASNVPFFASSVGTGTPKLDLDTADLSDEIIASLSGATIGEDGIVKLTAKSTAPYVSVILKAQGLSGEDIFIALPKGKFGHPDGLDLKSAEDKGQEPDTTDGSLSGSFVARKLDGLVYAKGRSNVTGFTEKAFEELIFNGYTAPTEATAGE